MPGMSIRPHEMNSTRHRALDILSPFLLLITALIWGSAFVAQKGGMEHLGPFTFTVSRSLLGGVFLLGVLGVRKLLGIPTPHAGEPGYWRNILLGGFACGTSLFVSSMLQQIGLLYTTPGLSGFITAIYVLIVPILGLLLGHPPGRYIWPGVLLACVGLYLICVNGPIAIGKGEALTMGCALGFSVQILFIAHFAPKTDTIAMSCAQLFVGAIEGLPFLLLPAEASRISLASFSAGFGSIAFSGVLSSGVAYTLQMIAQDQTPPALASILMSLESVFALLAGWIVLHQTQTPRQLLGCGLVFAAVVFTQLAAVWSQGPAEEGR